MLCSLRRGLEAFVFPNHTTRRELENHQETDAQRVGLACPEPHSVLLAEHLPGSGCLSGEACVSPCSLSL